MSANMVEHSYRNMIAAMNYETLVSVSGMEESAVRSMFSRVAESVSVYEPLLIHLQLYSELSSVNRITLADTYLKVKQRFTELLSSDSTLWEHDRLYPHSLAASALHPPFLYFRGDASLVGAPRAGITGTRNPSERGKRIVREVVEVLIANAITPLTTLEKGIEGMAQLFTLSLGERSIAFLDTSVHQIRLPQREKLCDAIGKKGLLVSAVSPAGIERWKDLLTYKSYVNAYATSLIVIEEKDGGFAVKRMEDALDQNIPVLLFSSSVEDRSLLWPRRICDHPCVHVIKQPSEIPAVLKASRAPQPVHDNQLSLF
ncbi:MAG: DNA-processing protein DprA [Sphaerochaetaceae bacterium]|nr:DNA-processing protein DprA [Sphaerochaetaceae bacterium]